MAATGAAAAAAASALRLVAVPVARQAAPAAAPAAAAKRLDASSFLFAWRGSAGDRAPASSASAPTPTPTPQSSLPPISAAATLADGAVLLAAHAREAGERRLEREWRAVEEAAPGTLKGWLHRLANAVQSRSDPTEAALARIPRTLDAHSPAVAAAIRRARREERGTGASPAAASAAAPPSPEEALPPPQLHPHHRHPHPHQFEILHPASVDPRFVRRYLRRLCQKRAPEHRRGALLWAAALVPQAPLSVLPLPNVTVYYTLWRAFMHWSAGVGARSLLGALDRLSDEQRRALARAATRPDGGVTSAAPSSSSSSSSSSAPLPVPVLVARDDLPSPLAGPADAKRLAALLDQPHIVERYAALARRLERRGGKEVAATAAATAAEARRG